MARSKFIKDASILTLGTSIAQFCPLVFYPVLGRIYSPEQFAALAAFTSVLSVLQVVGSGKYEQAILIANTDKEAANIFSLAMIGSIVLMICLGLILLLFGAEFTFPYSSGLGNLVWLTPIGCVMLNVFTCYNEWCVRKQYFKKLSINKITNSASVTLGKFIMYYTPVWTKGLTFGDFLGRVLTAAVCVIRLYIRDWVSFKSVTVSGMKQVAIRYKKFPIYTMPAQLLNSVAVAAPIFILGYYYPKESVGLFSMAMTVLILPVNVISYSVRDVFRKKANDQYRSQGHFDSLYRKIFVSFAIFAVLACVICAPFLPQMFSYVLGEKWYDAGVYSQLLLPMIVLDFIAMSLSGVFIVVEKLNQLFYWQCFYFITTILPLLVCGSLGFSIEQSLVAFCIGRSLAYLYMVALMYHYSKGTSR